MRTAAIDPPDRIAFNRILPDGQAPDWVELLPPGPEIAGRDGRLWRLDDPQAVVAEFHQRDIPLCLDWEHASEHRAPHGLDAPAAGWIDTVEVRNGAVWGHVEWTARAAAHLAAREYRFLSPVFQYEKISGRIVRLTSAGLTNQPNLPLSALNREESVMPLLNALRSVLELPGEPDESQVIATVQDLKSALASARNAAAAPALEKFVPRADYDAALARASNAETKIRELETARLAARVEDLIAKGLTNGQIVPATVEYYRAMCQTDHGVEAFEAFLAKAPPVLGAPTGLDERAPPKGTALNAELQQVAALFGHSIDDLRQFGGVQ